MRSLSIGHAIIRCAPLPALLLVTACAVSNRLDRFECGDALPLKLADSPVDADALYRSLLALPQPNTNRARRDELHRRLRAAGCTPETLSEPETRWLRRSNVVCELRGASREVIVVGAHYDRSSDGQGAVDNWTGVTMLPFLFGEMKSAPRRYSYRFIGFGGEEQEMAGSSHYLRALDDEELKRIRAMVNIDTFGLRTVRIDPRSSRELACSAIAAARALDLPVAGTALGPPLRGDWEPFRARGIPVINLHALSTPDLGILHTRRDRMSRVEREHFTASYRLISALLQTLDGGAVGGEAN